MEELIELQAKLEQCRRHSDNHRRSRDYHKERVATLRNDLEEQKAITEFWQEQFGRMDQAYIVERRQAHVWSTVAYVFIGFSIAMTVLFAWAIRL